MQRISVLPRALGVALLCAALPGLAAAAAGPQPAAPQTQNLPPSTSATPAKSGTPLSGPASNRTPSPKPGTASSAGAPKSTTKTKPGTSAAAKGATPKLKPKQKPGEVLDLDWRELLPENERSRYSASAPPPEHGRLGEGGPPAPQKQTTTFNDELGDMVVRMPGFVVPVGPPRNGLVNEFFLVPYIGACIHVPPPPPNQIVYVTSASGIAADAIHEAYWVTGKMRIESRTTALGTAAYAVAASKVELYEY